MVSETVWVPEEPNVWVGFCNPLTPPSPKSHDQEVITPVVIFEMSVKEVVFPIQTFVAVKLAAGNGFTEAEIGRAHV